MKTSIERRARRAGLDVRKCRRGTVYLDPISGDSVYDGRRSNKSSKHERRIESFIRRREHGGLG
jgi:hypothetical protein